MRQPTIKEQSLANGRNVVIVPGRFGRKPASQVVGTQDPIATCCNMP
jgi:hypothetical protein